MELSADTGNTVEVGSVGFSVGLPVGLRLESIEDWDVFVLKPAFLLELVLWLGLEIEFEVVGNCWVVADCRGMVESGHIGAVAVAELVALVLVVLVLVVVSVLVLGHAERLSFDPFEK